MAKFTWGESVRIAEDAPASVRPGTPAEVVGISERRDGHGSHLQGFPGGVVYTVEFEDGSDTEVDEEYLVPLASKDEVK
ncbi:MAG TPA: hypothetical protein VG456_24235 [Candidatus Sulfopaludibacter sp.]|jgi:hypothetical protein|nr:hypothetical protein [Candidatus Sulfopaludibacter sp.]